MTTIEMTNPAETKDQLRRIMGHYATGATIVTASVDGVPHGLAVNSFTSVSLDPPLVLFCPDKRSDTWPAIQRAGHFAVNILGAGQDNLCRQFSKKGADRFAEVTHTPRGSGSPVLDAAAAYLECRIEAVHDAGDHYVTIGRVLDLGIMDEQPGLVFYKGRFHTLPDLDHDHDHSDRRVSRGGEGR